MIERGYKYLETKILCNYFICMRTETFLYIMEKIYSGLAGFHWGVCVIKNKIAGVIKSTAPELNFENCEDVTKCISKWDYSKQWNIWLNSLECRSK